MKEFDVVVVGSGFGGSITALRLAEAGRNVAVLERGRRWGLKFPRNVRDIDTLLWRRRADPRARGLYDVRFFTDVGAVCAAGVGGGSLVYANIHIRPPARVFEDERWPDDYRRSTLDPYYDRVASMFGSSPLPPETLLAKRRLFRDAGAAMQREVFDPDQAVAWNESPGAGRSKCVLCTECEFGCPHGAKNTLDFTYLPRAEALGATVIAETEIRCVRSVPGGGYSLHGWSHATGETCEFRAKRVVLSAGTLGTNEILARSRAEGGLTGLSAKLGVGYSANGDYLGNVQNSREPIDGSEGPDVTTVMRFDEAPWFTMAAPTFSRPVMESLVGLGQPSIAWMQPATRLLWPCLSTLLPLAFKLGAFDRKQPPAKKAAAVRMTNLFAIGRDNANGRFVWGDDRVDIRWDFARENAALLARMEAAMREVARHYGGTFANLPLWDLFGRTFTVHSLGGCHLATSPERGVVDTRGEVFGHPGLFVADGSVIPTAIGFHPVMTISAVCERFAEHIARGR